MNKILCCDVSRKYDVYLDEDAQFSPSVRPHPNHITTTQINTNYSFCVKIRKDFYEN